MSVWRGGGVHVAVWRSAAVRSWVLQFGGSGRVAVFERMASAWGGGKTPHHSRSSISASGMAHNEPSPSPLLPVETEL